MARPRPEPQELVRLLAAVAQGDERAFEAFYGLCSAHVYGLLLRMLRRHDLAEEALQDCFLRVWHKSVTYTPEKGPALVWLSSIARYRALDLLRQPHPEVEMALAENVPLLLEDVRENPEARALENEGLRRLTGCLEQLREEQRRCMLLAYYEGYTHADLARVMGVPMGTIKTWLRRGMARLRRCLERGDSVVRDNEVP